MWGIGPRVPHEKNQLPRPKTVTNKDGRKCKDFKAKKPPENGIIRLKIKISKKFKKLPRGIWPRVPRAKNQPPS